MNKKIKAIAAALAVTAAAAVTAMSGCGEQTVTYTGEYKYANEWDADSYYGVKVKVAVNSENVIESVKIVDSDYEEVTDSWEGKSAWTDSVDALLERYKGKTVDEVKSELVAVEDGGAPLTQEDDGFNAYNEDYLAAGATQSSGRLLLAIQNALKDL